MPFSTLQDDDHSRFFELIHLRANLESSTCFLNLIAYEPRRSSIISLPNKDHADNLRPEEGSWRAF